jgi:hypothetical protein
MNREEVKCPYCGTAILDHPADRCLNSWVAEKVMGYHYCPAPYSTNMGWAWEVIEKLKHLSPCIWYETDDGYGWRVMFQAPYADVINESAPLAICRAALIAVMEDE